MGSWGLSWGHIKAWWPSRQLSSQWAQNIPLLSPVLTVYQTRCQAKEKQKDNILQATNSSMQMTRVTSLQANGSQTRYRCGIYLLCGAVVQQEVLHSSRPWAKFTVCLKLCMCFIGFHSGLLVSYQLSKNPPEDGMTWWNKFDFI